MALPYSTRTAWVAKSVSLTKTNTADLKPFEIGIFNYDSGNAVSTFTQSPFIFFAIGSPNQPSRVSSSPHINPLIDRNQTMSFKSDKMYGKELLPARVAHPSKKTNPMVITVGYDGINISSNLNFTYGETYLVNIRTYGAAAKAMFGKEGVNDTIVVTMPTKDACDTSCTLTDISYMAIDELVNKINNSWVSPAVRAEKLISCCPATSLTKYICQEYTLSLCDDGSEISLAKVQVAYPTDVVTILSKVGSITNYHLTRNTTVVSPSIPAAPVAFTQTDVVLVNCTTCPTGYTTTAPAKILQVTIENSGTSTTPTQALAEVTTVISSAITAIKTAYQYGASSYIVTVPLTFVMPAPVAGTTIFDTSNISPQVCTSQTPVTSTWNVGNVYYRVKRSLVVTLDNPDCAGSDLATLQNLYSHVPSVDPASIVVAPVTAILPANPGNCKTIFNLDQYSNCMFDGCDTVEVAQFVSLPMFKGQVWHVDLNTGWTLSAGGCPVPPTATTPLNCSVGFKLIGGFLDMSTRTCIFNPNDSVNYDPLTFELSITKQLSPGEPGGLAPLFNTPITVNRAVTRQFLTGQEVIRDIMEYRYYRANELYVNPDAFEGAYRFSSAEGQKFGVDVNKFYYAVYINHDKLGRMWNQHMDMAAKTELVIYYEEADYGVMLQFLALYNGYTGTAGLSLPAITV